MGGGLCFLLRVKQRKVLRRMKSLYGNYEYCRSFQRGVCLLSPGQIPRLYTTLTTTPLPSAQAFFLTYSFCTNGQELRPIFECLISENWTTLRMKVSHGEPCPRRFAAYVHQSLGKQTDWSSEWGRLGGR